MHRVLILGAGKIGTLISGLLAESGSYQVQLGDVDAAAAVAVANAHASPQLTAHELDATNAPALAAHLAAHPVDAVISSLPYYCNVGVAEAARQAGLGDREITRTLDSARNGGRTRVPDYQPEAGDHA